jgi:hypothetical protein
LDDPASVAFDGAGLNEADFDFNAGSDDFDVTLDETLTVVGRFAKCPRLCASFLGLDMGLLVAIDPSFASMTASRAVTGTAPPTGRQGSEEARAFTAHDLTEKQHQTINRSIFIETGDSVYNTYRQCSGLCGQLRY